MRSFSMKLLLHLFFPTLPSPSPSYAADRHPPPCRPASQPPVGLDSLAVAVQRKGRKRERGRERKREGRREEEGPPSAVVLTPPASLATAAVVGHQATIAGGREEKEREKERGAGEMEGGDQPLSRAVQIRLAAGRSGLPGVAVPASRLPELHRASARRFPSLSTPVGSLLRQIHRPPSLAGLAGAPPPSTGLPPGSAACRRAPPLSEIGRKEEKGEASCRPPLSHRRKQ